MEFLAAFGGAWFGIFMLAVLVLGIVSAEYDSFFMGSATLLVGLAVAEFVFAVPVWAAIVANPLMVLMIIALYVAVGALYTALWRWPDWINTRAPAIKSAFADWTRDNNGMPVEGGYATAFEAFTHSYKYRDFTAAENKERLSTWTLMWPWSLFWVLANRPARWIWNQSYCVLGQLFDKVGRAQARRSVERLNK